MTSREKEYRRCVKKLPKPHCFVCGKVRGRFHVFYNITFNLGDRYWIAGHACTKRCCSDFASKCAKLFKLTPRK